MTPPSIYLVEARRRSAEVCKARGGDSYAYITGRHDQDDALRALADTLRQFNWMPAA